MPRSLAAFLLLALAGAAMPAVVQAQIHRCITTDGTQVYTDRRCEDIGAAAAPVVPTAPGATGNWRAYRSPCARSVQDLAYALDSAIRSGDVNQVAAVYDWSGMSTSNAYRLMARLEAIAKRPLVDVQPMYAGGTNEYGDSIVQFNEETGEVISQPTRPPRLVGLRVEQTLGRSSTPSRTVFGLRKALGCWWVRF